MTYSVSVFLVWSAIIVTSSAAPSKTKFSLVVGDFNASNIPGVAGKDYPVMRDIPLTSFECNGLPPGIYADYDTRCQVFHMCDDDKKQFTFLCPNGTLFNEKRIKCDWWNKVSCKTTQSLVNLMFPIKPGSKGKSLPKSGQVVAQDRTLDLVDSISDLIKYARRRQQDDVDDEENGGSRFRDIMRKVLRIITTGL